MTDLKTIIKEIEAKHKEQIKAEKATAMKKYREQEKKKQEAEKKNNIAKFEKYCKLMNNDLQLVFGCLENGVIALNKHDQGKLDYFRGLVQTK